MHDLNEPQIPENLINGPPWEKRHELGIFLALVETIRYFLWQPATAFSVIRRDEKISSALLYVVGLQVFTTLWHYALADALGEPIPIIPPEMADLLGNPTNLTRWAIMLFPVWLIVFHIAKGYAIHLALRFRGDQRYSFNLAFRVLAYGSGTASVLLLIPVVGSIASLGFSIYLAYQGIQVVYGIRGMSFVGLLFVATMVLLGLLLAALLAMGLLEVLILLLV